MSQTRVAGFRFNNYRGAADKTAAGLLALTLLLAATACEQRNRPPSPERRSGKERVVSLAPNLTEMVVAVGGADLLVGRSRVCNYPPEIVKNVPIVGDFGAPSIELLVAARPTLILDVALADEAIGARIGGLKLRRERIDCRRLDDIPVALERIGEYLALTNEARALAEPLRLEIVRLRAAAGAVTNRPRVFIEIWNDPFYTVGSTSFLSELVAIAGGRNIGDDVAKEYYQVAAEWVVARDPEVVLCFYIAGDRPPRETVMARAGWGSMNAVRNRRIYDGFDNDIMLRPGPRVLDGIDALAKAIAAVPAFGPRE